MIKNEHELLAVPLAALSVFCLGFLWYTFIFAKPLQKEIRIGDKGKNVKTPNLGKLLVGSLILEVIMAFNLAEFPDADWMFSG